MASLPGMPGNLGLPAGTGPLQPSGTGFGSDLSLDTGSDTSTPVSLIVNRTLYMAPVETISGTDTEIIQDGVAIIPPTTEGNTLIVVGMSGPYPNWPKFNGIIPGRNAGWNSGGGDPTPVNTPDNGFSGDSGPYPNGFNSGSSIAYWTNIPGGLSEVSWDHISDSNVGPWTPTRAMIYELLPCSVVDLKGTGEVNYVTDWPLQSPPDFAIPPVNGPVSGGFYIASMMYGDYPTISGAFVAVNNPWEFDYQETHTGPVHNCIAGAIAFIPTGGGTQGAIFTWDGSTENPRYGGTTIALLPTGATGPPTSGSDLDQFLPNAWVVS